MTVHVAPVWLARAVVVVARSKMNAAKKIRLYLQSGQDAAQVEILLQLAFSLQTGKPFQLQPLHDLDEPYFDTALQLIREWHLDHHIASRSKLLEMIYARGQRVVARNAPPPAVTEH